MDEEKPSWRVRWQWFTDHPQACDGRCICPCCGIPTETEDIESCRVCGWDDISLAAVPSGDEDEIGIEEGRRNVAVGLYYLPCADAEAEPAHFAPEVAEMKRDLLSWVERLLAGKAPAHDAGAELRRRLKTLDRLLAARKHGI